MSDKCLKSELARLFGARLRCQEPLARHTSFRIGGPADYWIDVESADEVRALLQCAGEYGVPIWILGGGTNVLVSDSGVRGIVMHLGRSFATREWKLIGSRVHVRVGAACSLKKLVREAVSRDLTGLEFAEGIPGTVGGGLLMNAGAFGGEICDVLTAVEVVRADGSQARIESECLRFGYRYLDLPQGTLVTVVELALMPAPRELIWARYGAAKEKRERHQPRGYPSAGSVFKNPPGEFAGRLLESVGMKGCRIGGAVVSTQHANFILNMGGASAEDVYALMCEGQRRVYEAYGIRLEPEIRLIGERGA